MISLLLTPGNRDQLVRRARKILRDGGIVIFPTDTLYGLGANAELEEAVARVFRIKGRDRSKPISVSVPDMDGLERLAVIDHEIRGVLSEILPGPFTTILKSSGELPHISMGGKIGVRIPDHEITRKLCRDFPITATSANLSGTAGPHDSREVSIEADLLLDGGPTKRGLGSTVVDFTGDAPRILRDGSGDGHLLHRVLKKHGIARPGSHT